jgi:signal transduction histidine kinase
VLRICCDIALYVAGFVISIAALSNVPGTTRPAEAAGGTPELLGLGIGLFLLAAIAWVTVFFRRFLPLLPLIAGAVLTVIGMDYLLLLVGAHHALLQWAPKRGRISAALATTLIVTFVVRENTTGWGDAGMLAVIVRDASEGESSAGVLWTVTALLAALALLTSFGTAVLVRTRRESLVLRNRADQEQGRAAALTVEVGRQAERERLARDIHDALAHRLSVISLQSGALEEATRSRDETVARAAQALRQQAHASLDDLRGLLGELRSEPRSSGDEEAAVPPSMASMRTIGHLIRSVRQGGAIVDALVLIEDAERAGAALDRTAYRIVQESLTNALKHAPGVPIAVYVEAAAASGVRIRVSNPVLPESGADARRPEGAGRGVAGIRERAHLLGGTAWTGESEGQFVVDVSLPWPEAE